MDTWLVHSHHDINSKPWDSHGIKLQPADIENGLEVWFTDHKNVHADQIEITERRSIRRSSRENEYNAALYAIAKIESPNIAVVSLIWTHQYANSCDKKWRVLTPKRVWLAMYREGSEVFSLPSSFHNEGSCYTFLSCLEGSDWLAFLENNLMTPPKAA